MKRLIIILFFLSTLPSWAQTPSYFSKGGKDTAIVISQDTIPLPFSISASKRLPKEDIENKKEGWYLTGLPRLTRDPIRGFSLGGDGFLFNNKNRQDPFFYYTPYRSSMSMSLRAAQNGRIDGALGVDFPYFLNTTWRLRGDIIYANDPNWQYFGVGSQTLQRLNYIDKKTGLRVDNARFSNYYQNLLFTRPGRGSEYGENPSLTYTDRHYNEVDYTQFLIGLAAEQTFFQGRMRLMLGLELLLTNINHYDHSLVKDALNSLTEEETEALQGQTKITEDYLAKLNNPDSYWARYNIGGYHGGRMVLFQTALMWDSRDQEPDPSKGIFAEYSQEISAPFIGSQFNFSKHLIHGIFYHRIFPQWLSRTVLTGRVAIGHVRGSHIPFTEIFDLGGASEGGGIPVLGGERALRGYRESRFTGMVTALANIELRTRFYQMNILNQHLAFYAVPFYDAGRVWDSFSTIELNNFRGNPGLGARIAWNQATILRFDYAWSREDAQFFFTYRHTF
jgi:outer membrane protein assembly factor BamA